MGDSERSDAANRLQKQIESMDATVTNRFDNYTNPFSYNAMLSNAGQIGDRSTAQIKRSSAESLRNAVQGTAQRLNQQGIGGSVAEDMQRRNMTDVNKSQSESLVNLANMIASQQQGIMQAGNQNKLQTTQAGQQADFYNVMNQLQKLNLQRGNIQNMDDTTAFDDVLAVANTAGQFIPFL